MGCAKTTVDAWIKAGCPVAMQSPKRGVAHVFDTAAVIKWHVAGATFALVGKVDGATTLNLEHERARQAKASADKLEMENAEKRGLLAPVDQMALVWGAMLGNLKNRLLGMGAKLGPVIAPESRAPVCQSMIDGEIHEALIDLADYDPGTDPALTGAFAGLADLPSVVVHARALQLAEQHRPFAANLEEAALAVHVETGLDRLLLGRLGNLLQLAAAGHGVDLMAAGCLDSIDPDERFTHRFADREQTVIAQDQDLLPFDVANDAWLLVCVEGRSLEVVIADPAHDGQRLLAHWQQTVLLHRNRGAKAAVSVDDAVAFVARHVDCSVDDEARRVHWIVALANQVPFTVDLDKRRGGDLFKKHAEGIEQKVVLGPRHSEREMCVVEVGPAVKRSESVGGGKLAAGLPLLGADVRRTPILRELNNLGFGHGT